MGGKPHRKTSHSVHPSQLRSFFFFFSFKRQEKYLLFLYLFTHIVSPKNPRRGRQTGEEGKRENRKEKENIFSSCPSGICTFFFVSLCFFVTPGGHCDHSSDTRYHQGVNTDHLHLLFSFSLLSLSSPPTSFSFLLLFS